jgi:hypothetical protein
VSELPEALSSVLSYCAQQLGVAVPPVQLAESLQTDLELLPDLEPQLVVRPASGGNPGRLAFAAARALSCCSPGRLQIYGRRGTDLKIAVLATLLCCRPGVQPPDPEGSVAWFAEAIRASTLDLEQLQGLLEEVLAADRKINLSQWIRAVGCTSARIGLMVSGDVPTALEAVRDEPFVEQDLTGFALDPSYNYMCRERGQVE